MKMDEIQCVLVGQKENLFPDLVEELKRNPTEFRFIEVKANSQAIVKALKKHKSANFVFISEKYRISLEKLSDLIWQHSSDAIVVVLSENTQTTELKLPYNNTQFFRLNFEKGSYQTHFTLKFLIDLAQTKYNFRRCKNLLSVCEKRSQWLVDTSREAIAFISRDIHLYANKEYLKLFQVENLNQLQTRTVKDFILSDEQALFNDYQKNQSKLRNTSNSLLLSMRKTNGAVFRANIYVIPSIFRGKKCFQLWVQDLNHQESSVLNQKYPLENTTENQIKKSQLNEPNPFATIVTHNNSLTVEQSKKSTDKRKETPASLLKSIIQRKEAVIKTYSLTDLKNLNQFKKKETQSHYLLSLSVPQAQKNGVDNLLASMASINHKRLQEKFWDKVKITRLLQSLVTKDELNLQLFVRLSISSLSDPSFIKWIVPGLNRLGNKTNNLVFIFPSSMKAEQRSMVLKFAKVLRSYNIKIAQDNFSVSDGPILMLKQIKPEYVRFSLPWVRQIEGNESREIGLSGVIRQFESKGIKIIAPCNFSKNMRKLFILSGTSFCQERST